jgi:hypothetical protein
MGFGLIAGALSGAGNSVAQSAGDFQKFSDTAAMKARDAEIEQAMLKHRADANVEMSNRIADYNNGIANAPANRAREIMAGVSGQVPVDADQIGPSSAKALGMFTDGISGNVSKLRERFAKIAADPSATDVQRSNASDVLDQVNAQAAAQQGGSMRDMTQHERLAAAYEAAMAKGDLQAAALLKAAIPEKTIKVGQNESIVSATDPTKVIFANTAGIDKERQKIEADRDMQSVKGKQEAILAAMRLDPLGINAPPGGYVKALSGKSDDTLAPADGGDAPVTLAERLQGKTGNAALKEMPVAVANRVKAILDGRESFPSTARNNPRSAQLLDLAAQVDPDFDAVNFNKRNQTAAAFAKGKQGDALRAANQAIAHAGSLYDSIEKLDNFSGAATPLNYLVNPTEKFFGDERQGVFHQKAVAVASELRKVFAGSGGGSLSELKEWQESFPVNASQHAQKAYLMSGMELLQGAVDSLQTQYENGMGKASGMKSLISPKSQAILDKINGKAPSSTNPSDAAPSASNVPDIFSQADAILGGK